MHIMMFEFLKKLDDGKKCYKPDFIPHRLCNMRSQKLWAKCYKNGLKCTHSFIKGFNCDTILQSLRLSKSLHTFNFFNNSPPGFQYNPWILQCCLLRQKFITNLWNVVQTWWGFSVFFCACVQASTETEPQWNLGCFCCCWWWWLKRTSMGKRVIEPLRFFFLDYFKQNLKFHSQTCKDLSHTPS